MKLVIAIVAMVVVVQCKAFHGPPPAINEDCIRQTGVNRNQLSNFDLPKLEASKELRCYRRCIDINNGRLLENNMPNVDSPEILRRAPPGTDLNKIKSAAAGCQTETASMTDPCDNWFAMMKCMGKKFGH